jgi:hypothetical protein
MRMRLTICMLHILLMQVLLHVADVYAETRSWAMNCSGLSSAGSTSLSVSRIQLSEAGENFFQRFRRRLARPCAASRTAAARRRQYWCGGRDPSPRDAGSSSVVGTAIHLVTSNTPWPTRPGCCVLPWLAPTGPAVTDCAGATDYKASKACVL